MKINKGLKILKGGRFFHISDNYNKAKAVKNFIKIIKLISNNRFLTVSLGDSENDICMLESTDYRCIVKRKANKISLKNIKIFILVRTEAPNGWRESLEFVIRMESKISDFYQNGIVATLHNFSERTYDELEKELINYSKFRPITLILPSYIQS